MLQLIKEASTTIKLLITLVILISQSFISEFKDFTIRTNQLIKLSLARARSMMP